MITTELSLPTSHQVSASLRASAFLRASASCFAQRPPGFKAPSKRDPFEQKALTEQKALNRRKLLIEQKLLMRKVPERMSLSWCGGAGREQKLKRSRRCKEKGGEQEESSSRDLSRNGQSLRNGQSPRNGQEPQEGKKASEKPRADRFHVLAVEDNEETRVLLKAQLEGVCDLLMAQGEEEALEVLFGPKPDSRNEVSPRGKSPTNDFDLLLIDIRLDSTAPPAKSPEKEGGARLLRLIRGQAGGEESVAEEETPAVEDSLRKRARQDEGLGEVPAIAITSHTGPRARRRLLDLGFDGYLGKPYRKEDLFEAIRETVPEEKLPEPIC